MMAARRAVPFLCALALLTALWLPTLNWPLGRDQGTFAAAADVMRHGGVLYRDAVDLKPPAVYALYAAALTLGSPVHAIRLLDLVMLSATLCAALTLFPPRRRLLLGLLLALVGGSVWFFLGDHWNAALPDSWTALPVLLALAADLRLRRRRPVLAHLVSGAAIGTAFWLKYPAGVFLALAPLHGLLRGESLGSVVRGVLISLAGFAAVAVLVVAAFAWRGALADLWEMGFLYPARYASYQPEIPGDRVLMGFNLSQAGRGLRIHFQWFPILAVGPLVLVALSALRQRWGHGALWLALVLASVSVAVQRKFYLNHLGALTPWLSLLTALGLETLVRTASGRRQSPVRTVREGLALVACLALVALLTLGSTRFPRALSTARRSLAYAVGSITQEEHLAPFTTGDSSALANWRVAQHLRVATAPGSSLFIWGFEPDVYILADRRPASRFISNAPLAAPGGGPWCEEVLRTLQANPPARILVLRGDDLWYLHGVHGDSWQTLSTAAPALESWIRKRWTVETQIEDFTVLR